MKCIITPFILVFIRVSIVYSTFFFPDPELLTQNGMTSNIEKKKKKKNSALRVFYDYDYDYYYNSLF